MALEGEKGRHPDGLPRMNLNGFANRVRRLRASQAEPGGARVEAALAAADQAVSTHFSPPASLRSPVGSVARC
jgi:hypothetical protein